MAKQITLSGSVVFILTLFYAIDGESVYSIKYLIKLLITFYY